MEAQKMVCVSGGASGADTAWVQEVLTLGGSADIMSFKGHRRTVVSGDPFVRELDPTKLARGFLDLERANKLLLHRRWPPTSPYICNLILRSWWQVIKSDSIYAIGKWSIPYKIVDGGTGWACALGPHFDRPTYFFNQEEEAWYLWIGPAYTGSFHRIQPPKIVTCKFAGIGTRKLDETGLEAIRDILRRTVSK